ncbi:ABC transporter ATP-binding protein [Chryseolinea sp. H1M3-3]|uniref:ABC transporter ATP-binding protein n=1 Tax=Chryseolinea sp. H1M3-3 TaxID=3034144 RepID=UPI0023ECB57F|nr:ABC transporter ATP-binding protein [Chryseolinea sp. H1M3-3]
MNTVIRVEDVSKQYRLGKIGTGSFTHDLNRWWHAIRGKENPYLKIGEVNDRTMRSTSEYVWALKDISFDVQQGDVIGIIGNNGAGKSTLLKLLSRTTLPTTGNIKIKGRIASLLEVGTGFHPELSGRENVFLNGAILGMTRAEIKRKFDEILDFSGVEKYIDTPVKRYSSGMYVRLAFGVAAHLDPEVLIVDEVLAVGDTEFQRKALGRMKEVSHKEGRTVLFVSHNMASIRQLCTKGFYMKNGAIMFQGGVEEAIHKYNSQNVNSDLTSCYKKKEIQKNAIEVIEAEVLGRDLKNKNLFNADEDIIIRLTCAKNEMLPGIQGYFVIKNELEEFYIESDTYDFLPNILDDLDIGLHVLYLTIPNRVLPKGKFNVYLNFTSHFSSKGHNLDSPRDILSFEVYDSTTRRGQQRKAHSNMIIEWKKDFKL